MFFWEREGGGGHPIKKMHGHKESYTDLNLKILTSGQVKVTKNMKTTVSAIH